MTNEVTTFEFFSNAALNTTDRVRVVTIDGNPWFVAADVCRALGVKPQPSGGYSNRLGALARDERRVVASTDTTVDLGGRWFSVLFPSGGGRITLISESDLYKLIMRSNGPEAYQFQDWVTREVLPAIRKDGAYIQGEELVRTGELSEDEFVLRAITIFQVKVQCLTAERDAPASPRSLGW